MASPRSPLPDLERIGNLFPGNVFMQTWDDRMNLLLIKNVWKAHGIVSRSQPSFWLFPHKQKCYLNIFKAHWDEKDPVEGFTIRKGIFYGWKLILSFILMPAFSAI